MWPDFFLLLLQSLQKVVWLLISEKIHKNQLFSYLAEPGKIQIQKMDYHSDQQKEYHEGKNLQMD